jgi:hypothetical protein
MQGYGSKKCLFVSDGNHFVESLLGEWLAGKDGIPVRVSPFPAMELRLLRGRRVPDFGQNWPLFHITMRIIGVQPSGAVTMSFGLIILTGVKKVVATAVGMVIFAGEQQVVVSVRIGVDK